MIRLFCTGLFLIAVIAVSAQNKVFLVKAGEVPEKTIPIEEVYFFPSFTNGAAILKDGGRSNQRFNYHCLLDELQFLSGDDTLAIAQPGLLHKVEIDSITYYYYKGYLRQLMKADKYTLTVKERITMSDRRKEGGYGISSGTSAIDNYANIYRDGRAFRLQSNEDVFFKKEYTLYLGDVYNHFIVADRKGFYNFFSGKHRGIDNYIKVEKINFSNVDDVKKLFLFCTNK